MKKVVYSMLVVSFALFSCGGEEKKDEKKDEKKTEAKNEDHEGDDHADDHSTSGGWPQVQQDAFMTNCVDGVKGTPEINGEEYCSCMLEKVMEKYPNAADAINMDRSWMQAEAVKCLGQ